MGMWVFLYLFPFKTYLCSLMVILFGTRALSYMLGGTVGRTVMSRNWRLASAHCINPLNHVKEANRSVFGFGWMENVPKLACYFA